MNNNCIEEIEEKISDLKARWPAHSVPPSMWQQLEELEEELERAKKDSDSQQLIKYQRLGLNQRPRAYVITNDNTN